MKLIDRIGVRLVLIEGPDEEANGVITIKNLSNRTQQTLPLNDAILKLKELLAEEISM